MDAETVTKITLEIESIKESLDAISDAINK